MANLSIIDKEYVQWINDLKIRYRNSQIKASVKVNSEQIEYYWNLGKDIFELKLDNKYGSRFYKNLSNDLSVELSGADGFSERNLRYMKEFYSLYYQQVEILPQLVAKLCLVPWGHHRVIIDSAKFDGEKALFFVRKTIENGWSRSMLLNFIDTNLYEREGKAVTNFSATLPEPMSDLAKEITRDPYNFAFAGITGRYNEKLLKSALLRNITEFLIELGSGFAYVGKEYRLEIGDTENFIDLLFYHLNLRCYVVVEVKVDKFTPGDIGQLSTYVVACNHILKREDDKPTIGLLVCKNKDNTMAQYALEGSSQPIGISSYELEKLYPTNVEGLIPTIEELEAKL
ncbi:MAG: PDDEXK nuclease domain-containing protein [Bacteroidales bacterium]|nr:PDDEXK nuclease domain-containing protein [Bacteroidales bacterium]